MQLTFEHGGEVVTLGIEPDGGGWRVRLPDGSEHAISAECLPNDILRIVDGGRVFRVPFARTDRGLEISHAGHAYAFTPAPSGRKPGAARKPAGTLAAPMGGVVADVLVAEGQTVDAYAPLVVVEAMKVYATIEAPFAGTVKSVSVKKGDRVELGQQMVDLSEP